MSVNTNGKNPTTSAYFILAKAKAIYVTPKNSIIKGAKVRHPNNKSYKNVHMQ